MGAKAVFDHVLDLRDQRLGAFALDGDDGFRRSAELPPVLREAVGADRLAPRRVVIAGVGRGVFSLTTIQV